MNQLQIALLIIVSTILLPNVLMSQPAEPGAPTSLIALLADGRTSSNRVIAVAGYLSVGESGSFLFASSEHADAKDLTSAILLDIPLDRLQLANMKSGGWVRVVGKYDRGNPTTAEPWAGKIGPIQDIRELR